ncbi:protein mono-ADP-ribosyltransferase PARP12-like [Denticeps clupeoides]|uniref:Uncharacterized protein n=1 Tax=Denticeps clupeoides TaxID=299321 RepID=A0AAY4DK68_9TELE|nr:protein mono-ADP-ribosyltransferase PARP12-like [Denticeps clupeoides]
MSSLVAAGVTQVLCRSDGSLRFQQLRRVLGQKMTVADSVLSAVLTDEDRFVVVRDVSGTRRDSLVVARTSLRLCPDAGCGGGCGDLHLCRYSVCGKCRFGAKCKNPHVLSSAHNCAVLDRAGLVDLSLSEVCLLLLQNDSALLPEICSHYNKGNGEHGSCKFQASCTGLHVCQHFLLGDCKFGASCKRAHTFTSNSMKILGRRGLSPENIGILEKIYKNRLLIAGERPVQMAEKSPPAVERCSRQRTTSSVSEDSSEICLFFIRQSCSFKEKCIRLHCRLPYKWQLLDQDGKTWRDLEHGEDVEKDYCDPARNSSSGPQPVDFLKMTCGGRPVRRLSTASSVTKPPHFILTTEWRWYWRDDAGSWTEYGQQNDAKQQTAITSQTLENIFLADTDAEFPFSIAGHDYILYLKDMYQVNIKYRTKRAVRRRPRFLSGQDVEDKLRSGSVEASSSSSVDVPAHWDKAALPNFTYKMVPLSNTDAEYRLMEELFKRTMTKNKIHGIRRVQNPSLWRVFQWQKQQMKQRNGGSDVDERYLFHGTDGSLLEAICEQNFDWRMCGVHGSHYGKGSYFARDACYSDRYCKSRSSTKVMFVGRVLVGDFVKGNSSYVRPPARKVGKGFYDCCVDNEVNPSIFVIFEKYQIYPEFIVEYS